MRYLNDSKQDVILSISEYAELKADQSQLRHLEACGVDNWEGYSYFEEE